MRLLPVDEELELRLLHLEHAAELFALTERNRVYLRTWLPWLDTVTTVADTENYIRTTLSNFACTQAFMAGIWTDEKLIGVVGHNTINWDHRISQLGYWLAEEHQGKGVMSRALRSVVAQGFSQLEINRFVVTVATENRRSRAVPERLGFMLEGTLRQAEWLYDHYVDHAVYGLLRSEWKDSR